MKRSRTASACALFVAAGVLLGCSVGGGDPFLADAGPLDASVFVERDTGPQPEEAWDCDPFENGIFVTGTRYDESGIVPRTLNRFDPPSGAFTELADVRDCIEGWYIRSMAVGRDGVVHFLLGNQTLATYRLSDGSCERRALPRHEDTGLYQLVSFVGDPSAPRRERLIVAFSPTALRGYELIEVDEASFEETSLGLIPTENSTLVSLAGTADGRLLATRSRGQDDERRVDLVELADGLTLRSVASVPFRSEVWFRSAVVLWDTRVFVFDAVQSTPTVRSTASEVDLEGQSWSEPVWSADAFEVQAVATTTCQTLI